MIEIVKGIDVNKIKQAIELLTGLTPKETITEDRYCLSLGCKRPLEVGYDKRRKVLTEENMSFSAHLKMLSELSIMMREEANFLVWLSEQPLEQNHVCVFKCATCGNCSGSEEMQNVCE